MRVEIRPSPVEILRDALVNLPYCGVILPIVAHANIRRLILVDHGRGPGFAYGVNDHFNLVDLDTCKHLQYRIQIVLSKIHHCSTNVVRIVVRIMVRIDAPAQ